MKSKCHIRLDLFYNKLYMNKRTIKKNTPRYKKRKQNRSKRKIYGSGRDQISIPTIDVESIGECSKENTHIIWIDGLGCTSRTPTEKEEWKKHFNVHGYDHKCHRMDKAITSILTTSIGATPLHDKFLYDLINEVLTLALNQYVFLFGHSFGGLIANRVGEELLLLYEHEKNEENKKKLEQLFKRINIGTFGSIYIPRIVRESKLLKIMSYVAIGDVSNTTTWGIKHKQITKQASLDLKYTRYYQSETGLEFYYKKRANENVYDICSVINGEPTCLNSLNNYPIARAGVEWTIHNESYFDIIILLIKHRTIDIKEIPSDE